MMLKAIIIFIVFIVWIACPTTSFSDSVYTAGITDWQLIDTHTIMFYAGKKPVAIIEVSLCFVYPHSRIRFLSDVLEWGETILIDKEVCDIWKVKKIR